MKHFNAKEILSTEQNTGEHLLIDEDMRMQIQKQLLSIYQDVAEVCAKHDLSIFLCGGSALGAIRHQGFIPWDDDMDAAMTREDYNQFQQLFSQELSNSYILKAPNYENGSRNRFPKIMKKGTLFREIGDISPEEECGLCLDIFILDNVPDNRLLKTMKGVLCNLLEFISGQVLHEEEHNKAVFLQLKKGSRFHYYLRRLTGIVFSYKKAADWNRKIDKLIQYNINTKYCTLATGRKHYFGEILPREVYLPGCPGQFEGNPVLLFSDPHVYLSNLYGDYMKIPEESKRERHFVEEIRLPD